MKKYKVEWNAGDGGFRLYEVLREIEELKDYDCASWMTTGSSVSMCWRMIRTRLC